MVLKRCTHCGNQADDSEFSVTHKSTCKSRGKPEDYQILETSPKKVTTKKSHGT